jgi:serine/threonine protein kinase
MRPSSVRSLWEAPVFLSCSGVKTYVGPVLAVEDLAELCIVMELCPFGDLDQKIRRFYQRRRLIDEREIWVYAINILEGLAALHSKHVVHRGEWIVSPGRGARRSSLRALCILTDLKPANCLIDAVGCVKIADMNISKVNKGAEMKVSSPRFPPYRMPPGAETTSCRGRHKWARHTS